MEKKEIKGKCSQLFWYFLFFSVIGLLLETLFCYITTEMCIRDSLLTIESKQLREFFSPLFFFY